MNRYLLILFLILWGGTAQSQTLQPVTRQFDLGTLSKTDSVRFYVEYPEYSPLSKDGVDYLNALGVKPSSEVKFHVRTGRSRGRTIAEVSFLPAIYRQGRWQRMVDFELKYEVIHPVRSAAIRSILGTAAQAGQTARYAGQSVLAQGRWVKIRVKGEGIYQLTDAQLSKMGFSDPSRVKLYGYGGRLLPDVLSFSGKNALIDDLCEVPLFRRTGSVLFWAEGLTRHTSDGLFLTNTFSRYSYYFLTEGENPASWQQAARPAGEAVSVSECTAYSVYDNDAFVWYGGGRDFYDSSDLQGGHTFSLSLPGNVGGTCRVYYDVTAQSTSSSPQYMITRVAGSEIVAKGTISQTGENESAKGVRGSFQAELGTEERFKVTTTASGRLNYLYCRYAQQLSTLYTTAAFTTSQTGAADLKVASADVNTRVWQLNDTGQLVTELPGELDGAVYTAHTSDGSARFALVDVSATSYPSPDVVGEIENQNLHADGAADYVIIVPASGKLLAQAERLAEAHRQKSGMRVRVVRADQLYNEFSSGTPDVAAYRRYLKMLYDRASGEADMPRYLLLMGDGAYDNRMITSEWKGASPDDYLLAYERNDQERVVNGGYSIGTLHSYVTDDYFALLDDGEGAQFSSVSGSVTDKLDLGVGRFLCHTEADAEWLVAQALAYMDNEQVGAWKNKMWAVGDVGDNNLHMNDANGVVQQVEKAAGSSFLLRRINPDLYAPTLTAKGATYPEATQKLKTAMQQGALIFNYNGHGSPDRLSHSFLLSKEEMAANVSPSRPLWIYASCEITPFDQAVDDLGRSALFNRQAPAIAVLCAARTVYADRNRALNEGFVKYAFARDNAGRRYTLGDALRLSKCELVSSTGEGNTIGFDKTINKLKYVLLGDPALSLAYPDAGITIDSINSRAVSATSEAEQLPIGSKVRFSGFVGSPTSVDTPDTAFNGVLTATVFTPLQTLTCKGTGSTSVEPFEYKDYTKVVFDGSVEVHEGRFILEFVVPRGLEFSTQEALLSLYAADNSTRRECNGSFTRFCFNGIAPTAEADTLGPDLYLYLNSPDFPDGGIVSTQATFYASIVDSTAISIVSGSLGHDMELWLDGDASTTQVLNDYFAFNHGSYSEGLVSYPLANLQPGRHTLTFRAWDAFDNSSTSTLSFVVREGYADKFDINATRTSASQTRFVISMPEAVGSDLQATAEVYSLTGARLWHGGAPLLSGNRQVAIDWSLTDYSGSLLPPGVYLYRGIVGSEKTGAKKWIVNPR